MKKFAKKAFVLTFVLLLGALLFNPFLRMGLSASTLGETYLFLERMSINTETDMILMFTPSSNFEDAGEGRILRIYFPEGEDGDWCITEGEFTSVEGVGSGESPIDTTGWSIEEALPGDLTANCVQGGAGERDYIEVTGITVLDGGTSYGVEFGAQAALFTTGPSTEDNLISVQLVEDMKTESITFEINLTALDQDQLTVTADVDPSESITCTIGSSTVPMGTLYRGGAYSTANHTLATDSGTGFYWAVYGEGHDNTAGLVGPESYVLSSEGAEGVVDLIGGEGFGLVVSSSSHGDVETNYLPNTPGQFGAISSGFDSAKLILTSPSANATYTITLGARAGVGATEGAYSETLTYICGAYIGE